MYIVYLALMSLVLFILMGLIYLFEAMSVVLQVFSFKVFGLFLQFSLSLF